LARCLAEAVAVTQLRHQYIVQIYDIGESSGCPYFALEFIEWGSLARRLRGDPHPVEPTVRLTETLARAIHFAHENGIVHRDLKPANILLTSPPPPAPPPPGGRGETASTPPPLVGEGGRGGGGGVRQISDRG